jgi:hypothetical protein
MPRRDWSATDQTGREAVREWAEGFRSLAAAARDAGLGSDGRQNLHSYLKKNRGLGMERAHLVATASGVPWAAVLIPDVPVRRLLELGLEGAEAPESPEAA